MSIPVLRLSACFCFAALICACVELETAVEASPPHQAPEAEILLGKIKAAGPGDLSFPFRLRFNNSGPESAAFSAEALEVTVNGQAVKGVSLDMAKNGSAPPGESFIEGSLRITEFPDVASLPKDAPERARALLAVSLGITYRFENGDTASSRARGELGFTRIARPRFTIKKITILKNTLINTRLKVTMEIANPNPFPLELSAFNYELFGQGQFWADGVRKNSSEIAADSVIESPVFLLMNFTNTQRSLFDKVEALHSVSYRFRGTADISSGIDYLPVFTDSFDLRGEAPVTE